MVVNTDSAVVWLEYAMQMITITVQIVASIHSSSYSSIHRHCILACEYDIDKELVMQGAEKFVSSDDINISCSLQCEHFLEIVKDKVQKETRRCSHRICGTSDNFDFMFIGNQPSIFK